MREMEDLLSEATRRREVAEQELSLANDLMGSLGEDAAARPGVAGGIVGGWKDINDLIGKLPFPPSSLLPPSRRFRAPGYFAILLLRPCIDAFSHRICAWERSRSLRRFSSSHTHALFQLPLRSLSCAGYPRASFHRTSAVSGLNASPPTEAFCLPRSAPLVMDSNPRPLPGGLLPTPGSARARQTVRLPISAEETESPPQEDKLQLPSGDAAEGVLRTQLRGACAELGLGAVDEDLQLPAMVRLCWTLQIAADEGEFPPNPRCTSAKLFVRGATRAVGCDPTLCGTQARRSGAGRPLSRSRWPTSGSRQPSLRASSSSWGASPLRFLSQTPW